MEEEERREKKERKVGRKSEWGKEQSVEHYLAFIIGHGGVLLVNVKSKTQVQIY